MDSTVPLRILFIGDVVGSPGVDFVIRAVPVLRKVENLDLVIANGENASGGSGMTPGVYRQLRSASIDGFTMGDHIYKKSDLIKLMEKGEPICKPANFPEEAPGQSHLIRTAPTGVRVAVISLLGRTYMRPVDCPFRAVDRILGNLPADVRCILVDVHAEATADKYLLGHHLKGRVSAVVGTHTHVPTADEQILPGGTAFVCDVGMTGPYDGILGRCVDRVLSAAIGFVPTSFDVATGDVRLGGALIEVDPQTGVARSIRRVMLDEAGLARLQQSGESSESGSTRR